MNDEPSGTIISGFEGIDSHFTQISEVRRTTHNVLVRAMRHGQWWLLKGLLPEEADYEVFQEMLCKEFEIHSKLQHPNIARAYSLETVEGLGQCIVMEWVEGETLKAFLERQPSIEERRKVAMELIEGVKYMHQNDVVHRDLKPGNIMVTRNGHTVKIIDFGLADTDAYAMLKQPAGTENYMSPEQKAGGAPDVRNDIYSLGVILGQMGFGSKINMVVRRCLQPIESRYQSILELERDMRGITGNEPSGRTFFRSFLPFLIVAGLLLAGALGYYLYNHSDKGLDKFDVQEVTSDDYEAALSTIESGLYYQIFTAVGGTKYYLTEAGTLTNKAEEASPFRFTAVNAKGTLYPTGWCLGVPFVGATLDNDGSGNIVNKGCINFSNFYEKDNNRQVLFLRDGKYAVRATNATNDAYWDANTFWDVVGTKASPVIGYSHTPSFIWQLNCLGNRNKENIEAMYELLASTNVYTKEAYNAYEALADGYLAQYEAGTLTELVVSPYEQSMYKSNDKTASNQFLLSAWSVDGEPCVEYEKALYINTWSLEGYTNDGEFKYPFYEYWTYDDHSLANTILSATVEGLEPGAYDVDILTRVRLKGNCDEVPTGITMCVNSGDPVDLCTGAVPENKTNTVFGADYAQFHIGKFTATGVVGADGILHIEIVVEGTNCSWLSFKKVRYYKR